MKNETVKIKKKAIKVNLTTVMKSTSRNMEELGKANQQVILMLNTFVTRKLKIKTESNL